MPRRQPMRALYGWYFRHILPRMGQWLARNDHAAYRYLPESVGEFPAGAALVARMEAAGLRECGTIRSPAASPHSMWVSNRRPTMRPRTRHDQCELRRPADNAGVNRQRKKPIMNLTHGHRSWWASPVPAARSTPRGCSKSLLELGHQVHVTISRSGQTLLKQELSLDVDLQQFDPAALQLFVPGDGIWTDSPIITSRDYLSPMASGSARVVRHGDLSLFGRHVKCRGARYAART